MSNTILTSSLVAKETLAVIENNCAFGGMVNREYETAQSLSLIHICCQDWINEYRIYRRDDKGKVVKKHDHLMDASRYLVRTCLLYTSRCV